MSPWTMGTRVTHAALPRASISLARGLCLGRYVLAEAIADVPANPSGTQH